jgi:O-antigen/teichoic acid export membrane protein
VLSVGTLLGQGIVVIASPVLTRLFSPDDFGVFGVYVSLLGIFSVVASLRYQLSIPFPEKEEEAANLLALSLVIVLFMSVIISLAVWLFNLQIVNAMKVPALRPYLWLLPLGVAMVGSYQVFNFWCVRKQAFGRIAQTKVSQGLSSVLIQIGLGALKFSPIGLLVGHIVGQAAGTTTLAVLAWKSDRGALKTISIKEMSCMGLRFRRFPLFSSWSGVLNNLSVQLPVLMLSYYFGPLTTGLYALGHRVLTLPMRFVGQAASQVFFSEAVDANRKGSLAVTTKRIFERLVQIAVPGFLIIGFSAPGLFTLAFGQQWREAGDYAQWLTPWLFVVFVCSPLSILPSIREKQGKEAVFNLVLLISRIGAIATGGMLQSARISIGSFAVVSTVCWLCFMLWVLGLSGNSPRRVFGILFTEVIAASPAVVPIIIASIVLESDSALLVSIGLSVLLSAPRFIRNVRRMKYDEALPPTLIH